MGCEKISDMNVVATRPRGEGVFSTTDGEDLPISRIPDVIFEQGCVGPLLDNDVLQLPPLVFFRPDAKADRVDSVSVFFKHSGGTPACDLQSSE